ncbi:MAG: riboflavin biosynthesis protein RibF [Anaerolineae bacterium]|jgi:riboflavin kinase/FMN adenylyltransferase
MQIIDDLAQVSLRQETILTIGAFDGLHRGHQALIEAVVQRARDTDRLAALITFHPHPVVVLAPERAPRYLTTPGEKLALLEKLGVDLVVLLPFDSEMADMPARAFMERASGHLRLRELWVGADFALGRDREGTADRLRSLGAELDYDVTVFQTVLSQGQNVSSSRIRSLLLEGRVEEATELLGRYPSTAGEVIRGAQMGQLPDFPTAKLKVRPERAMPADGIYAVFAVLGSERYQGLANIGISPSFGDGHRTVETHIFGFDEDIHGCDLVVEFVSRLRGMRRFEDLDDLRAQIEADSQAARRILTQQQAQMLGHPLDARCYRFRELAHTADRALGVWGEGLPDLFVGAARGMCSLMGDLEDLTPDVWRVIQVETDDLEALLVEWLNELLFLVEQEGLLFLEFRIQSVRDPVQAAGGGAALVVNVGGTLAPVTRAHIKAATYHDLELVHDETGWSTVITFDV